MNFNNEVTVIIVMYQESFDIINKTLEHIKNFKKIIIDNANNEDLKIKLVSKFSIYKYILNKKNIGFSAGYNQGINLSNTRFTLILGPDCLIKEQDINILVKKILYYKDCYIVAPTSYDEHGKLTYTGGHLPEKGNKFFPINIEGDVCVDSVLGACMLFDTRKFYDEKLYFDNNFFLYFSDDDLCRTIKKKKKSVIQIFDAKCIHSHGNIKVKNRLKKIFIREYNFVFDKLYYDYKENKEKNLNVKLKKKILNLTFNFFIKIFTFQFLKSVKIFSRLCAYFIFNKKHLRRDGRVV